ncbi:lysosomal acid phosphatase [Trichinella spiralis]|uniref:lysosomal acid phosphatase n=1 Tax=Trichinella spiralis TaxID=6334 RepID=UPI0001EFE217|nr:lysosomal acid phosphatase [Trichinella spiralis]
MYRHGYRTPLGTFPTDEYQEWAYPNGFRQLTKLGCQQQYELGQYLRSRYANFLSDHYNASEVKYGQNVIERRMQPGGACFRRMKVKFGTKIFDGNLSQWHTLPTNQEYVMEILNACETI